MIAFLLVFALASSVLSGLAMWLAAAALRVPPLVVSIGSGPKIIDVPIGGTRLQAGVLLISSYLQFEDGERRAARLPGLARRLALGLVPVALGVAVAVAILGEPALGETARGFGQLFRIAWPIGDGTELVGKLDALLARQGVLAAVGVVAAKIAAFNLMFTLTSAYVWYGSFTERRPPTWALLPVLVALLMTTGAAINTARYLL